MCNLKVKHLLSNANLSLETYSKSQKETRLSNTRISNKQKFEQIVVAKECNQIIIKYFSMMQKQNIFNYTMHSIKLVSTNVPKPQFPNIDIFQKPQTSQ